MPHGRLFIPKRDGVTNVPTGTIERMLRNRRVRSGKTPQGTRHIARTAIVTEGQSLVGRNRSEFFCITLQNSKHAQQDLGIFVVRHTDADPFGDNGEGIPRILSRRSGFHTLLAGRMCIDVCYRFYSGLYDCGGGVVLGCGGGKSCGEGGDSGGVGVCDEGAGGVVVSADPELAFFAVEGVGAEGCEFYWNFVGAEAVHFFIVFDCKAVVEEESVVALLAVGVVYLCTRCNHLQSLMMRKEGDRVERLL